MRVLFLAAWLLATLASVANAQTYPSDRVTVIVPFGPGSGTDGITRIVFQRVSEMLQTTFVIENKPGANGALGATAAARAKPDGYTLIVGGSSTHAANPSMLKSIQYDPQNDFAPISLLGMFPYFLVINPDIPAKNVKDLVELAKTKPGTLSFGSANALSQLSGEILKQRASIDIISVPYKASPQAVTDLITGRISMMFMDMTPAIAQVQSGTARALAVTTPNRSSMFPDLPSIKEEVPDFIDLPAWSGVFAPKGTPPEIIEKIAQTTRAVLAEPETRRRLAEIGFEAQWMNPQAFAEHAANDRARWAKVTREAGIERQ